MGVGPQSEGLVVFVDGCGRACSLYGGETMIPWNRKSKSIAISMNATSTAVLKGLKPQP